MCGLLALNVRGVIQAIRDHDEIARGLAGNYNICATVLREDKITNVDAKELAPGDIMPVSKVRCLSRCTRQSRNLMNAIGRISTSRWSRSIIGQYIFN